MSNTLAFEPVPRSQQQTAKSPLRAGLAAMFKAALESLVAAQSRRFENTDQLQYRFPPI